MASHPLRSIKPRARQACAACHRRKVRCDVSRRDPPCSNCRDTGAHCTVRKKPDIIIPAPIFLDNAILECGSLPLPLSNSLANSFQLQLQPQPVSHLGPLDGDTWTNINSEATNVSVLFVCYPFLVAKRLHCLNSSDTAYLLETGSLHVPSGYVLDTFVRHYFLHVHPCLPLINEAEFWRIYRGQDPSHEISLLLFKAMLFAAASFVPLDVIKLCGFQSFIAARNYLHRSAQLLYDFQLETDHFIIAQAALLLSYHSSNADQLSNTTWLAVAIQNARFEHAHEYNHGSLMTATKRERSELKRLWWSCCLRDRNLSIGLRRPLQITTDNFDFNQECLTVEDLEGEIDYSEVYNSDVKAALSKIAVSLCKLAVAVTNLVMAIYPAGGFNCSKPCSKDEQIDMLHKLDEAKTSLALWKQGSVISSESLPGDAHPSVSLYTALTSLYYHSARIALCHQMGFLLNTYTHNVEEEEIKRLEDCKHELADSVDSITDKMKRLNMTGSAKYLPINAVAYTMLPQILVTLNIRLSSTPTDKEKHEQTLGYFTEVSRLYQIRFDTTHVNSYIQEVLGLFESERLGDEGLPTSVATVPRTSDGKSFCDIFVKHPGTYLYLSMLLDRFLSRGKNARRDDLLLPYIGESAFGMALGKSRSCGLVTEMQETSNALLPLPSKGISIFSDLYSDYLSLPTAYVDFENIEETDSLEVTNMDSDQVWSSEVAATANQMMECIALFGE